MSNAGSWLRERREELHLSRSGVERVTGESANKAADERYRIRRGRLTDLEAGRSWAVTGIRIAVPKSAHL
jgi:hypothetical protein